VIDDEDVVERLRRAHDVAPVAPIDPGVVLRAGRRWRRRRAGARWAGLASASVGAAVLAVGLAVGWLPLPDREVTPAAGDFVPVTVLDTYAGVPVGVPDPWFGDDGAAWQDVPPLVNLQDGSVTLWTGGSFSCPTAPRAIRAEGRVLEVVVGRPHPDGPCTMDFRITTYVVAFPVGYAPDGEPTVRVIDADSPRDARGDLPDPMPSSDGGPAACRPALTVCAMNRWLADMLIAAGYDPLGEHLDAVAGSEYVDVEGGHIRWSLYPVERAPGRAPMQVEWTLDTGEVVVEHGTRTSGVTPTAEFTCGGFRIEAEPSGPGVPARIVTQISDAAASTITDCPANLDELLARYPDLQRR